MNVNDRSNDQRRPFEDAALWSFSYTLFDRKDTNDVDAHNGVLPKTTISMTTSANNDWGMRNMKHVLKVNVGARDTVLL